MILSFCQHIFTYMIINSALINSIIFPFPFLPRPLLAYSAKLEIVITRSETTCLRANTHRQAKQSKFTFMGLLHFVRNDTVYIPLPSIPSRLWRES